MRLLLATLLLMLAAPVRAVDLYVNNSGFPVCSDLTPKGNNSESNPWCTLLRAVRGNSDGNRNAPPVPSEAAAAGDTVYVSAGTYEYDHDTYQFDNTSEGIYEAANDGAPGSWIKFEAVGTVNLTTNYVPTGAWYRQGECAPIIGINGTSPRYIWWDGFTITQQTICYRHGKGVVTIAAGDLYVRISNMEIAGTFTDYAQGTDNHPGILVNSDSTCLNQNSNITIDNNRITGFVQATGSRNSTALMMYCVVGDVLIENNDFSSNTSGIYHKSTFGEASGDTTVRYNRFADNGGAGLLVLSVDEWDIYQNVFLRNEKGMHWHAENASNAAGGGYPADNSFYNNTLVDNQYSVYMEGNCEEFDNNESYNNFYWGATDDGMINEGANCQSTSYISATTMDFDYNDWEYADVLWSNDSAQVVAANLAAFRSTYSLGANSWEDLDPRFANEAVEDFRLCTAAGIPDPSCVGASALVNAGRGGVTVGAYITGNEVIGPGPGVEQAMTGALFLIDAN